MNSRARPARVLLENPGYREKKVLDTGTVIYVYSKGMLRHRHKQKAQRLERMRQEIPQIAQRVMRDLAGSGTRHKLALAVAVMAETFERVGSDMSARENGHYGITTMQVRHVKFGPSSASINYVAKSGVQQHKIIRKPSIIRALQRACSGKPNTAKVIDVTAPDVNNYLREFGITAKDIRGFFANETMAEKLKAIRTRGPTLPPAGGQRKRLLAAEFQECLVATAKEIGHTTSILKKDYLVPRMVARYLLDGTVVEKLAKLPKVEREREANVITAVHPRANPALRTNPVRNPAAAPVSRYTLRVFVGRTLLGTYAFEWRKGLTPMTLAKQGLRMRGANLFSVQRDKQLARWYRAVTVKGVRTVLPEQQRRVQVRRNPMGPAMDSRGSAYYGLRDGAVVKLPQVAAQELLRCKPDKNGRPAKLCRGFTALFHIPAEVEQRREGAYRVQMGDVSPIWTSTGGVR